MLIFFFKSPGDPLINRSDPMTNFLPVSCSMTHLTLFPSTVCVQNLGGHG